MEAHIFNSSVTLLFATVYILGSLALYYMYTYITNRLFNRNPDIELIYRNIREELSDIDPDIEIADPAKECKQDVRLLQPEQAERSERNERNERNERTTERATERPARKTHRIDSMEGSESELSVRKADSKTTKNAETVYASDVAFFVEVYGFGLVIFVVYYSVDMVLLTPALSLLYGLIILSIFDAISMLRSPQDFPDTVIASKFMNFIAMLLICVALVEMFIANSERINNQLVSEISSKSMLYIVLAYILPYVASLALGSMPRDCSRSVKIKRAFPLAVLLALFVVMLVLGLDTVVNEKNYYREAIFKVDEEWHQMFNLTHFAGFSPLDTVAATDQTIAAEVAMEMTTQVAPETAMERNVSTRGLLADPAFDPLQLLEDAIVPVRRSFPLLTILFEPLLKLALTFSVITAVVNRKATDTAAILALMTAVKEHHFATQNFSREHLFRSCLISSAAVFLCMLRYIPCIHRCISRL